jgi:hypothetical protein
MTARHTVVVMGHARHDPDFGLLNRLAIAHDVKGQRSVCPASEEVGEAPANDIRISKFEEASEDEFPTGQSC